MVKNGGLHGLTCLAQSLGNLKSLKEFRLSIPSVVKPKLEMHHMIKFICQGHAVSSLPSLSGMSCLASLSVRDCNLWQLPADLGRLSSLNSLNLSQNNFESIP